MECIAVACNMNASMDKTSGAGKRQPQHGSRRQRKRPAEAADPSQNVGELPAAVHNDMMSHQNQQKSLKKNGKGPAPIATLFLQDYHSVPPEPALPRTTMAVFPSALSCTEATAGVKVDTIVWQHSQRIIPITRQIEVAVAPILLRWGANERKMMLQQPSFRRAEVRAVCAQHDMPLSAALSLRRHMMRALNPYKSNDQLGLGNEQDIRESAAIYEHCVELVLRDRLQIPYYSEEEHKAHIRAHRKDDPYPPTPDFLLHTEVDLVVQDDTDANRTAPFRIAWIEVKKFYASSVMPMDGKSAVGSLLKTARKYVELYGPGGMVFSDGCSVELAASLRAVGVVALYGGVHSPVDIAPLEAQLRTWCGDENGNILP